jgi:carbon-monoxide dehydrogenase medium subunit
LKPIPSLNYQIPGSLEEALELLNSTEHPKILAGGTDLIPQIRGEEIYSRNIIDINNLRELSYVKDEEDHIKIGATTTHSHLIKSDIIKEHIPALYEAVSEIGSPQIRNIGTIGGNLCNASPAADTATPLLVHDSEVTVTSKKDVRVTPLQNLFAGPKINSLKEGEILTEIRFHKPSRRSGSAFRRIGRRKAFTLSIVNVAAYLELQGDSCKDVRIALGAVAGTPLRLYELEDRIRGELTSFALREAANNCIKYIDPITDLRSSAEYRREMTKMLTKRALEASLERVVT